MKSVAMKNFDEIVRERSEKWQRVVAVEAGTDCGAVVFRRSVDGQSVIREEHPFQPWLLVSGMELGSTIPDSCGVQELSGNGTMRARVVFETW